MTTLEELSDKVTAHIAAETPIIQQLAENVARIAVQVDAADKKADSLKVIHEKLERAVKLADDVADIKVNIASNTAITAEIKELVLGFRVIARIAKWTAGIGAAITTILATYHGALEAVRRIVK